MSALQQVRSQSCSLARHCSDKTLAELAKAIKNDVVPPTDEDSQSQEAGEEAAPSACEQRLEV